MIPHEHVIGLSILLFSVGVIGALCRRNLIVILMSIELMLNAVNLAFIGFDRAWAARAIASASALPGAATAATPVDGQIFVLMVITVAVAEIVVGLVIVISLVRNRDSLDVEDASLLRW